MQQKLGQTFSKVPPARSSNYGVQAWTWLRILPIETQVARSMGSADEEAHQATEQSWRNIDAIVQSSRAYADALQSISREMSNFCRERLDRNLERMNALMRSRTPQEFIAAQSDLLRDNFEGILQSSRRVAQASVGATDETTRRVTQVMGKRRRAA
jgi:hypothetical protein